ncbi:MULTISPECIES: hypothetical protein [Spirulina sp. CCY15215]|uniref:hypothetical protein n=1 Tax=Spirulina sp. CCY15215 TaxID=2767591 RepID=UPI0019509B63|nr:hypothetical protein [Spirulina major]
MTSPESSRQSDIARSLALLDRYGFDTKGYMSTELVARWLEKYEPHWIRLAAIEALYQGRYKVISVEQILTLWHRRGQPTPHFNSDFERLISRKLPDYFPTYPQLEYLEENAIAQRPEKPFRPIEPFGLFSRIELRKSVGIRSWQVNRETVPDKIKRFSEPSPLSSPLQIIPPALAVIRAHAGLSRIFSILESGLFIVPQLALPPVLSAEIELLREEEIPEKEWIFEIGEPEQLSDLELSTREVEERDRLKMSLEESYLQTANLSLDELENLELLDELEKIEIEKPKVQKEKKYTQDAQISEVKKTSKKAKSPVLPNPNLEKLYFFRSNIITFTPNKTNSYFFNKLKRFIPISSNTIANPDLELNLWD